MPAKPVGVAAILTDRPERRRRCKSPLTRIVEILDTGVTIALKRSLRVPILWLACMLPLPGGKPVRRVPSRPYWAPKIIRGRPTCSDS